MDVDQIKRRSKARGCPRTTLHAMILNLMPSGLLSAAQQMPRENQYREYPLDPILGVLRPCRQRQRDVSAATARRRGLGDQYRPVLQPYRIWRLEGRGLLGTVSAGSGGRHCGAERIQAVRCGPDG